MDFLQEFNKSTKNLQGVSSSAPKPAFWISTGSYIINKVISGMYRGGIAQGKMAMYTGPSSAGKSFLVGNTIRSAQQEGIGIFVVDSENALDENFLEAIGVDVHRDDFVYRGVSTIEQALKVVSSFLRAYRNSKSDHKFLVVIDSLDMLSTESAAAAYEAGDIKGDQGQHAKQMKNFLGGIMHDISDLNVAFLCTKQVYKEQDSMLSKNPVTEWKLTESVKYAFTQIALVTRFMLKDENTKKYEGIRLKVFGLKTRFTKPFQQAVIEVPYESGMDPYAGVLEAAESIGVVTRAGAWYTFKGEKFQSKNFDKFKEAVLEELIKHESEVLDVDPSTLVTVVAEEDAEPSALEKTRARAAKAAAAAAQEGE